MDKVEVSVDDGKSWEEAQLKEPIDDLSWRLWAYPWTPASAGTTPVMCRATDGDGSVQSSEQTEPHPSGAGGYHRLEVDVS